MMNFRLTIVVKSLKYPKLHLYNSPGLVKTYTLHPSRPLKRSSEKGAWHLMRAPFSEPLKKDETMMTFSRWLGVGLAVMR